MKTLFTTGLVFLILGGYAQDLKITNVKLKDNKVEILYDILDERIDRSYSVYLYTSRDNYIQPMEKVKGDVGVDIPVGHNKKIVWEAKDELGESFDGSVALELKGNFYIPFITIEGLNKGQEFKRGKSQDFIWSGGRGDNILNFELYKGENFVMKFDQRPNNGSTKITIPTSVKPGKDYRFKISDTKNRDEVVFTEVFTVKPKIPLHMKFLVTAITGVTAYYLYNELMPVKEVFIDEPPLPKL